MAPFAGALTPVVAPITLSSNTATTRGQDPGWVNPLVHEGEVTIDQQLPGNIGISGSWVFSRALHLPVFTDGNLSQTTATKTYTYPGGSTFTVPFYTSANRLNATGPILVGRSTVNSLYNSFVLNIRKAASSMGWNSISTIRSASRKTTARCRDSLALSTEPTRPSIPTTKRVCGRYPIWISAIAFSANVVWHVPAFRAALVEQTRQADCERVGAIGHLHRGHRAADHGLDHRYAGWARSMAVLTGGMVNNSGTPQPRATRDPSGSA